MLDGCEQNQTSLSYSAGHQSTQPNGLDAREPWPSLWMMFSKAVREAAQ